MTNYEKIKEMTLEELATFLCNSFDEAFNNCEECPAREYCRKGCNGFKVWLESEAKDEKKNPYCI